MPFGSKKAGNQKPGARQRQASVQAEIDSTMARLQTMDLMGTLEEEDSPASPDGGSAAAMASHPDGFRIGNDVVPPSGFKEIAILGVGTFSRVRMMQYKGVTYAMKMMKMTKVEVMKINETGGDEDDDGM